MTDLSELVERFGAVCKTPGGYAAAVMAAYGTLPEGQLYRDLFQAAAILSRLDPEELARVMKDAVLPARIRAETPLVRHTKDIVPADVLDALAQAIITHVTGERS